MYRLPTFFLALAVLLSSGLDAHAGPKTLSGPIPAFVEQVIDGDTLRVRARVWLGQEILVMVRINGVDAPELRSRCAAERVLARKVKHFVRDAIAGKKVTLTNIRRGKYAGRVIADVTTKSGADLGRELLDSGQARKYRKGRRKSWCGKPVIHGALNKSNMIR